MTIAEARKEYNKVLERFKKAEEYFDRTDISQEEKEKFLNNYIQVLNQLNQLLGQVGYFEVEEVLEGFNDYR